MPKDDAERIQVETRAELEAWLAENHTRTSGVWVVTFKKSAGDRYLPWEDVVRAGLC